MKSSTTTKASKVSKTMSFSLAYWAMFEQIKQKIGVQTYEEVIATACSKLFTQLGLGEPENV